MAETTTDDPYRPVGLPPGWRRADRWVIGATEALACAVGLAFTSLITLEVVARYVFDFSIFFINAAARFMLVWFFLLGAGLALRQGAHVGLELVVARLPRWLARATFALAQAAVLAFFLLMLWSGWRALGPAARQFEGALGISLVWVMLAFPVGFGLLVYHQVAIMVGAWRASRGSAP